MSKTILSNKKRLLKIGIVVIHDNSVLLCQPFAFDDLILPGGCLEANESHVQCLNREIKEELGDAAILEQDSLEYLGIFSDRAAGKSDRIVDIVLYSGKISGKLIPSSEIKQLIWYRPKSSNNKLSLIIERKIIPYLMEIGMLEMN